MAVEKGKGRLATVRRRECNDVRLLACACRAAAVYRRRRGRGGRADTAAASASASPGDRRLLAGLVTSRRSAPLVRRDLNRERIQQQRVDVGRGPVVRSGGHGKTTPWTRLADHPGLRPATRQDPRARQSLAAEAGPAVSVNT